MFAADAGIAFKALPGQTLGLLWGPLTQFDPCV